MSAREWLLAPEAWPVVPALALLLVALHLLERRRDRARAAALREAPPRPRRRLASLALLVAAAALLQPAAGRVAPLLPARPDLVFCLDVSRSMLADDAAPTRLAAAQRALQEHAAATEGERFALLLFAGSAELVVPLTDDGAAFTEAVQEASPDAIARGGTELGAALDLALDALRAAETRGGAIVLLTDGEDLGGDAAAAAQRCRARGVAVHAVGYGSPQGRKIALPSEEGPRFLVDRAGRDVVTRLDEEALAWIASATGGRYVAARTDATPLAPIVAAARADAPPTRDPAAAAPRPLFQWLLLAALLLALVESLGTRHGARHGARHEAHVAAAALLLLPVALLLPSCGEAGPTDDSAAARSAWTAAWASHGAGDRAAAARAAEEAALLGGAAIDARAAFLLAAADHAEGLPLAARALGPRGDREAAVLARERLRAALDLFARAAAEAEAADEPALRLAALRNGERCLLALEPLERLLAAAVEAPLVDERRQVNERSGGARPPTGVPPLREPPPSDEPTAELPPEEARDPVAPSAPLAAVQRELDEAALARLFEKLAEKEQEKRAARAALRQRTSADVERDW
ncbi:MAG: VWA domain-containing protein [Planctomycetes bacterium]|nr:VWA domain-containing protein [Planctomycetota bacterium]